MASSRAAILTPSPIRSPSASSTTSPRCTPTRNAMRLSGGTPVLRSTMAPWTSTAQRTASRQNPFLVGGGEPAVTDDVGGQDRRNFPGLARGALLRPVVAVFLH